MRTLILHLSKLFIFFVLIKLAAWPFEYLAKFSQSESGISWRELTMATISFLVQLTVIYFANRYTERKIKNENQEPEVNTSPESIFIFSKLIIFFTGIYCLIFSIPLLLNITGGFFILQGNASFEFLKFKLLENLDAVSLLFFGIFLMSNTAIFEKIVKNKRQPKNAQPDHNHVGQ